jgi:hypothetical protein
MNNNYSLEESSPKFRAKIFVDDQLFAIGQAEVSEDDVTFYPDAPKSLAISPNAQIHMTVKESQSPVILEFSKELSDVSSDSNWFLKIKSKNE